MYCVLWSQDTTVDNTRAVLLMWQWMCRFPVLATCNWLRTVLFWVMTHPIFRGSGFLTPEYGTGRLSRNVYATFSVTTQKSAVLFHFAAEAWNHVWLVDMRFGKEISSQYICFGLFVFNITGAGYLTLNTKARRSFKMSPTSDPTSQKAWFLISPSPGHNRGIYPTVGRVSLFPAVVSPCTVIPRLTSDPDNEFFG
jgi:hypothetical protein